MTHDQTLYLGSLESRRFEPVRTCRVLERPHTDAGKPALVVSLDPPVVGQDFDRGSDIEVVALLARFEGVSVHSIESFPCFVYIVLPPEGFTPSDPLVTERVRVIGWGECYRSKADAREQRFDRQSR